MTLNRRDVVDEVAVTADLWDPTSPTFLADVVAEAYLDGARVFWERRARQLEAARPRRGDYCGRATLDDLAELDQRLTAAAQACRRRAQLVALDLEEVRETLAGVLTEDLRATPGAA